MGIIVNLDKIMVDRKISSKSLAEKINMTTVNLSNLKNGKMQGIRFETLSALCETLGCQPGDLLQYDKSADYNKNDESLHDLNS